MKYTIDVPESSILNGELIIPIRIYGKHKFLKTGIRIEEEHEKQFDFEVGDEIIAKINFKDTLEDLYEPFIITNIQYDKGLVWGFGQKYATHCMNIDDVLKTGRHFSKNEIETIKKYLDNPLEEN